MKRRYDIDKRLLHAQRRAKTSKRPPYAQEEIKQKAYYMHGEALALKMGIIKNPILAWMCALRQLLFKGLNSSKTYNTPVFTSYIGTKKKIPLSLVIKIKIQNYKINI